VQNLASNLASIQLEAPYFRHAETYNVSDPISAAEAQTRCPASYPNFNQSIPCLSENNNNTSTTQTL